MTLGDHRAAHLRCGLHPSCLAIGLAGIGLYGAQSYSVSQRWRELGVRATRGALVSLVLREGERTSEGDRQDLLTVSAALRLD